MYRMFIVQLVVVLATTMQALADTSTSRFPQRPLFPPAHQFLLQPVPASTIRDQSTLGARGTGPVLEYADGALWGSLYDVDIQGHYAYCGMVEGLLVLDISDPAHPVWVSQLHLPGPGGFDVEVRDGVAYLCDGYAGIVTVDVTDPYHPSLLASHDTPVYARDIELSGDFAYVSDDGALCIFDVSNPRQPVRIADGWRLIGQAWASVPSGDYLYVAGGQGGVHVVDISIPNAPVQMPTLTNVGSSGVVTVSDNYLYTASQNFGALYKLDLIDPAAPVVAGTRSVNFPPWDMEVQNGIFFGSFQERVQFADIDHPPSFPDEDIFYHDAWNALGLELDDTLLYVADGVTGGLRVLHHYGAAAEPVMIGQYATPGSIERISVMGDLALARGRTTWPKFSSALHIVDVSNPERLVTRGMLAATGIIQDAEGDGYMAYVADDVAGLEVVDLTNPDQPRIVNTLSEVIAQDVALSSPYAYVGTPDGLKIFSLNDPVRPVLVSETGGMGAVGVVEVSEPYAYLATASAGFQVVDISRQDVPRPAGSTLISNVYDVAIQGRWAYVAHANSMTVIDVTDPQSPTPVGSFSMTGRASGISVLGSFAYVAASLYWDPREWGVWVIDVSNPASPAGVSFHHSAGHSLDVVVQGAHLLVADSDGLISLTRRFDNGDVNADGQVTSADVVHLANYLFGVGPSPLPTPLEADADCDGWVTLIDAVFLVNYLFRGGPPPC